MSEQRSKAEAYRAYGPATRAIHAGYRPDPATGAVNAPIYASSTFAQDGVGGLRGGFEYARTGNPTRSALEAGLAAVEHAAYGRAFSSGMAATDCALRAMLRPGDHVVIPDDAYGGTFRLIDKVFTKWGVEHTPAALSDLDAVRAAITAKTRLIWVETPTNPLLSIADIAAIVEVASASGAKVLVDNTFASPALQQPLRLGADVVLHSTTKYIGGHSDVVGGALLTNDEALDDAFAFLQNGAGAVSGAAHPSQPCGGRPADERVRRDGVGAAARRYRGCPQPVCPHRGLHPRGVARRRGVTDRAPGCHDARVH